MATAVVMAETIKRRGSIMPAILDLLYREYCRARLAEMRKQLLLRTGSDEAPDAIYDAMYPGSDEGSSLSDPKHAADRGKRI